MQDVYRATTPSKPEEGVSVIVCVAAVAANLNHTSAMEDIPTSQVAFASPLAVAFAISPAIFTQVVPTVNNCAPEQLSFAGGGGGGGGGVPLFIKL